MHRVIKPFKYSADMLNVEELSAGAERDFGDLAPGLLAAGYIAPVDAQEQLDLPSAVVVDAPVVEEAHEDEHEDDLTPPAAEEHHTARRSRRPKAKAE